MFTCLCFHLTLLCSNLMEDIDFTFPSQIKIKEYKRNKKRNGNQREKRRKNCHKEKKTNGTCHVYLFIRV